MQKKILIYFCLKQISWFSHEYNLEKSISHVLIAQKRRSETFDKWKRKTKKYCEEQVRETDKRKLLVYLNDACYISTINSKITAILPPCSFF